MHPKEIVDPARPALGRWIVLCAIAEAIGMTAAAAAAQVTDDWGLAGIPSLLVIVAGGLVEGAAVGALQAIGLAPWLSGGGRTRWFIVTLVVAGLGWAAATAPSQFSGPDGGGAPSLALVLVGGLALGAAMGALLGLGQALVLRGRVPHPLRWVGVSTLAWAPTMLLIFLGASIPDASWTTGAIILMGTITGVVAGAVFGVASGLFFPAVQGASVVNALVLGMLRLRARPATAGSMLGLRLRGRRSGRLIVLPVQGAAGPDGFVVYPGHAERKQWWRNLEGGAGLEILDRGTWAKSRGRATTPGDDGYEPALNTLRATWPRLRIPGDAPLVVIAYPPGGEGEAG